MKKKIWGFTLIELIIVIVIIGILALIAIPKYFANINKAKRAEALATMSGIRDAEQAYAAAASTDPKNNPYKGTLPISVDVDDDGTPDITMAQPQSANFTYTISGTDPNAYIIATKAPSTASHSSEAMCISSGRVADAATVTCP